MTPLRMAEIHGAAFTTQRPWTEGEFAALMADAHVFAVTEGAQCFALGRVVAGDAELLTIATDPAAQRQGLARKCMAHFLARAGQLGAETLFLEVDVTNHSAIPLYRSCGFDDAGRRKAYYQHPDGSRTDALVMSRAL